MSTPQNDIGTAIATVLEASPFTSVLDRAGYGTQKSSAGRAGAKGLALVTPLSSTIQVSYTDSVQMQYSYQIASRLIAGKKTPEDAVSAYLRALAVTFNENSRTLSASFTNTSTKVLGTTLISAIVSSDYDTTTDSPQAPEIFTFVTVTVWESI